MTLYYEHDGEQYKADESTELFSKTLPDVVFAYQFPDGTFADSDDVEEITIYEIFGKQYGDSSDAEKALTLSFWCTFGRNAFGEDEPARNEAFNNWIDHLCKDGEVCDDSYNDLCLDESA